MALGVKHIKRKTAIISDEQYVDLHAGKFGAYTAHRFGTDKTISYYDSTELTLGKDLWTSLGSPSKVRVTITPIYVTDE